MQHINIYTTEQFLCISVYSRRGDVCLGSVYVSTFGVKVFDKMREKPIIYYNNHVYAGKFTNLAQICVYNLFMFHHTLLRGCNKKAKSSHEARTHHLFQSTSLKEEHRDIIT